MKKFYESPEADVVVLFPSEQIAVLPGTDDGISTAADESGNLGTSGGVAGGSGRG